MNPETKHPDWDSLQQRHPLQRLDWLAEKGIFSISLSAILMVFLIILFVTREGFPILLEPAIKDAAETVIPLDQLTQTSPERIQQYLELTPSEYQSMDRETIELLMEVKLEELSESSSDKDAHLNTAHWRYLLFPHQWSGYESPKYIWQPISQIQKYNIIPLIIGSLKTSFVALLFAVPIAIGAAIYISQLAPRRTREWVKPMVELLAGIPSVVLGFFALIILASTLQDFFGYASRLNALVAGIVLGLAVIPIVFSLSEDALSSVPDEYTQAAYALGSTRWQAAYFIVLPAAMPGILASIVLGFGRAIGETMIVLMATGNASIVSWSALDSTRTITATIAAELAETVFGSEHYRVLFLLGTLLFAVTFVANIIGSIISHRLKQRLSVTQK